MAPLVARVPLADCEVAYKLLKADKKDSPTWRVHWVVCLALLRAVGHVLRQVDGVSNAERRAAIEKAWTEWKANKDDYALFWNFINEERNNVLKQYKFGVEPEHKYIVTHDGEQIVTQEGDAIITGDDYFRLSLQGFEDEEGRNVIGEAIKWWHDILDEIEAK